MQGNLNEIDIRSILQLIELGQRTGELFVEAYPTISISGENPYRHPNEQSWFVFFLNGQIIYATQSAGSLFRLKDYLWRYKVDTVLENLEVPSIGSVNAPEYGYLWALLENKIISPAQGRSIIQSMVYETLFDLLSLHQGSFIFEIGPALAPQLTTLEINPLVTKMVKQIQQWKQFHPYIQSPNQCPVISDATPLKEVLPPNAFGTLNRWADGKTSIRQIARYLNRDILTVAKAIYPFVQQGLVQLLYLSTAENNARKQEWHAHPIRTPRIVCIDDDVVVRETVESILDRHGYHITTISHPLKALSSVFQLKPDLILCDIAMPDLDGYEICAMLKSSTAFRQTPIVMLTGIDGFIDRVKARIVGSTDYFTKPFGESELLMLVEKYVGPGNPNSISAPPTLSAQGLDELQESELS